MNVTELARFLAVSRRTVQERFSRGMRAACQRDDGSYDGDLAAAWSDANVSSKKNDPLAPLKKKQLRAKIAISAEDLLAKRLKREVASGQLIYRDEVLGDFSELLGHARPLLDALPDEVAKECPQEVRVQVLQLVKHAVERYFHKLRSWRPKGTDESDPAGSAAAL